MQGFSSGTAGPTEGQLPALPEGADSIYTNYLEDRMDNFMPKNIDGNNSNERRLVTAASKRRSSQKCNGETRERDSQEELLLDGTQPWRSGRLRWPLGSNPSRMRTETVLGTRRGNALEW